jgi:hypothetical protein
MLQELFLSLTTEQISALDGAGIPRPRVSEWRKGKGLPDLPAAKALSMITGVPLGTIADELADLRASEKQLSFFKTAAKQTRRAVRNL